MTVLPGAAYLIPGIWSAVILKSHGLVGVNQPFVNAAGDSASHTITQRCKLLQMEEKGRRSYAAE